MISGRILGKTSNVNIESKIEWSATASAISNTSNVRASLYFRRTNQGYTTSGTGNFSLFINGVKHTSENVSLTIQNEWVFAMGASATVAHNTDGNKTITISAEGSLPPSSLKSVSCTGNVVLESIPQAAKITEISSVTLGGNCDVRFVPKSKEDTYRINFSLGNMSWTSGDLIPESQIIYIFTDYVFEVADWATEITESSNAFATATLSTYKNGKLIGSSETTFSIFVPSTDELKPTMSPAIEAVNSFAEKFSGLFIQGRSKIRGITTEIDTKYGAKTDLIAMTYDGVTVYEAPYISGYVSSSGNVDFYISDSRGMYNEYAVPVTVIPYSNPQIIPTADEKNIICERCDSEGNASASGSYLHIKLKRKYSYIQGTLNTCTVKYAIAEEGSTFSEGTTIMDGTSTSDDVDVVLNLGLSKKINYIVNLSVFDDVETQEQSLPFSIPSEAILLHKNAQIRSISIGEYIEASNTVAIAEDICVNVKGSLKSKGQNIAYLPIETGSNNGWKYTKYSNGDFYAVGEFELTTSTDSTTVGTHYLSDVFEIPLPFAATNVVSVANARQLFIPSRVGKDGNDSSIYYQFLNYCSWTAGIKIKAEIVVYGTIKGG